LEGYLNQRSDIRTRQRLPCDEFTRFLVAAFSGPFWISWSVPDLSRKLHRIFVISMIFQEDCGPDGGAYDLNYAQLFDNPSM